MKKELQRAGSGIGKRKGEERAWILGREMVKRKRRDMEYRKWGKERNSKREEIR